MRVQVVHALGRADARLKLSGFADALAAREWPGVTVRDLTRTWTGDRLDFSFAAAKGFFSLPIRGWLDVSDGEVVLDTDVPPVVLSMVGEAKIRDVLTAELSRLLSAS